MLFHEFLLRAARNDDIPYIREIVFSCLREYGLRPDPTGKDKDLKDIEKSYFTDNGFFGVAVEFNTNKMVGTFGIFPTDKNICELRKFYLVKGAANGYRKIHFKYCHSSGQRKRV